MPLISASAKLPKILRMMVEIALADDIGIIYDGNTERRRK
jgi:hypothetical protein